MTAVATKRLDEILYTGFWAQYSSNVLTGRNRLTLKGSQDSKNRYKIFIYGFGF